MVTLTFAAGCDNTQNKPLEIGTGVVDITPPFGYPRYGYLPEKSTGVIDPLNTKALVFRQGEIQGALLPGELFTEFGFDLKKRSPFANTMLIELANADIAYVPTQQAFKEGGYEPINSRLAPESGEQMINIAIEMLTELKK